MADLDLRLNKFTAAVMKDAGDRRAQMLAQVEQYKKDRLRHAEEDILIEAYHEIQDEITQIRAAASQRISQAILEQKKELLAKRAQIADQVFQEVTQKLAAFTACDAYGDKLRQLCEKAKQTLGAAGIAIEKREADQAYQPILREVFPDAQIRLAPDIRYGGLIFMSDAENLVLNETFDYALAAQREAFVRFSGLELSKSRL